MNGIADDLPFYDVSDAAFICGDEPLTSAAAVPRAPYPVTRSQ